MTADSRPFLDPDVAARVAHLEFRARQVVEGLVVGRHQSPFFGRSIEFAQHREYAPGDDMRHLDWKVWAKSDRYYIKQYEEETNLRATILLDASASMDYGTGPERKLEYAKTLAAAFSLLLLRQSDAVGLVVFDRDVRSTLPHRSQQAHLRTILSTLAAAAPDRDTDLDAAIGRILERESKRGAVIVLSDLLADRAGVMRALAAMGRRRHDAIVLHVLHDDEIDFPFEGTTRFEGMEDDRRLVCDPRGLRDGYREAMRDFLGQLRRTCAGAGIDYRVTRTSESPSAVLADLLHERSRAR